MNEKLVSKRCQLAPFFRLQIYVFLKGVGVDFPIEKIILEEEEINVTSEDFQTELKKQLDEAKAGGQKWLVVTSGDLHRNLNAKNRLPLSCGAMVAATRPCDVVMHAPASGQGANLKIFYWLLDCDRNRPL